MWKISSTTKRLWKYSWWKFILFSPIQSLSSTKCQGKHQSNFKGFSKGKTFANTFPMQIRKSKIVAAILCEYWRPEYCKMVIYINSILKPIAKFRRSSSRSTEYCRNLFVKNIWKTLSMRDRIIKDGVRKRSNPSKAKKKLYGNWNSMTSTSQWWEYQSRVEATVGILEINSWKLKISVTNPSSE